MAKVARGRRQAIVEPMDVVGLGTMAVFTDPTGAVFGVWQPGTFAGAELVNESGAFGWNELGTRDTAAAKEFYGAVFGWGFEDEESGETGTYTGLEGRRGDGRRHDRHHAAALPGRGAAALARLLHGRGHRRGGGDGQGRGRRASRFGPIDIPVGRFAVVTDPFGAVFAVMQPSEETLANMP